MENKCRAGLGQVVLCMLFWSFNVAVMSNDGFTFNGFRHANLSLNGISSISPDGLLIMTNSTKRCKGQAFYPLPLRFKPASSHNTTISFATTFVFAMVSEYSDVSSWGLTFAISPSIHPTGGVDQYFDLFNYTNNGKPTNHIIAVELDPLQNPEYGDIDDNHVGIDVNGVVSINSHTAGYFTDDDNRGFKSVKLISGEPMQIWVEYNSAGMQLNVTLAPIKIPKPKRPLMSSTINLSSILLDSMFVGFTAAEGDVLTRHYVLGWSFQMGGEVPALNISILPSLPQTFSRNKSKVLSTWLPIAGSVFLLMLVLIVAYIVIKRIKFAELIEDWEGEYVTHRFKYRDLYIATDGFKDKGLLGAGGFGSVYRGVLPVSKTEIAVKRVSHESRQGMRQFVAEIVSLGQLQHRNLVRLLGYCRRKRELLLVYDYLPNGSLDKYLFSEAVPGLDWARRFQIIKGVASGLLYLHEDWERLVLHRDIKASNVLLDSEFNGRLGDFGLARLYDHGTDPHTTHIVGTMGYLAPELTMTGKATTSTDVFAFGVFLLEVACGRRPIELKAPSEELYMLEWVLEKWQEGAVLEVRDRRLGGEYDVEEMELVLKLGLLCCHPLAPHRPSMRQVVQFLDGVVTLPELSPSCLVAGTEEDLSANCMISYSSSQLSASVGSNGR